MLPSWFPGPQVTGAEYNLAETVVRAPSEGYVTYVGLRPGARVSNLPLFKAMAFVDTSEQLLGAQIAQNFSRYVEPGQEAEVTFKALPGKVYPAKVLYLLPVTPVPVPGRPLYAQHQRPR